MKAVKKDLFDINKVTVVGSPTITSDGVASGFSSGNYLRLSNIVSKFINSLDWKFEGRFKVISSGVGFFLLGMPSSNNKPFGLYVNTTTGRIAVRLFVNVDGTATNYFTEAEDSFNDIGIGITYDFYFERKGNDITVALKEVGATTYTTHTRVYGDYPLYSNTNNDITLFNTGNVEYDLKQFSITVDGELVYSPTRPTTFLERRKEGFDLSKFTVVGSPTITEDGVYTCGYDEASYVKVPFDNNLDSFSFICIII